MMLQGKGHVNHISYGKHIHHGLIYMYHNKLLILDSLSNCSWKVLYRNLSAWTWLIGLITLMCFFHVGFCLQGLKFQETNFIEIIEYLPLYKYKGTIIFMHTLWCCWCQIKRAAKYGGFLLTMNFMKQICTINLP